ncbi:MAG: class I SAM-dependent methyltransferase [Candidatus Woesearchaeota archaeon]
MLHKYLKIKQEYENLLHKRLKEGRLPLKDTGIGYWAITSTDDIYALFRKINLHEYKSFIDLGSGDGRVAAIASIFTKATGIEYDKELHEIAASMPHSAQLIQGDFMEHDLSAYDIIFINPDKHSVELEEKFHNELNGTLIVFGNEFHPKTLSHVQTIIPHVSPATLYKR